VNFEAGETMGFCAKLRMKAFSRPQTTRRAED
jgi:hypothetical protein